MSFRLNWGRFRVAYGEPTYKIYVTRHVESDANADSKKRREKPSALIDITARGRKQLAETAVFYHDHFAAMARPPRRIRVVHSHYLRSERTAEAIYNAIYSWGGATLDIVESPLIHEIETGVYAGMTTAEIAEVNPHLADAIKLHEENEMGYFGPRVGGEQPSLSTVRLRLFFRDCHRWAQRENIEALVVVGHGHLNMVAFKDWLNRPVAWYQAQPPQLNGSVRLLSSDGSGIRHDHGYLFVPPTQPPPA